ncbi:pupal cuticle protein C1B-like [Drosophila obscura]|uniref:pupal cuticle protein C1B-like n=1 Tax=Drosophila obscura TaxID=7282 RepID=UPI001BB148DC|nr:pupal cuticle protein C1B-like [Drosophila obscura]
MPVLFGFGLVFVLYKTGLAVVPLSVSFIRFHSSTTQTKNTQNPLNMFKLVVLSALLAVAVARPGHLYESPLVYAAPATTTIVQEPYLANVGAVVKSIPTSVSHQSQSVVHSSAHVVQDVVAPVIKSYAAPVVHTSYAASPLVHTSYAAPYAAHTSYAATPVIYNAGW